MRSTASVAVPYPGKAFLTKDKAVINKMERLWWPLEAVGPAVTQALSAFKSLLIIVDTRGS